MNPILELDRESLLVHVSARAPMADVQTSLAREGLSLEGAYDGLIGGWLEAGAPGARSAWLDPADHLVAGFTARARSRAESFTVKPAPRRAVGPDLLALVLGLGGRLLVLESVWLRVHRSDVARPTLLFTHEAEPLTKGERALYDAIDDAML